MKFSDAKWNDLKTEMRQIMIELAKAGQTISYSEICILLKTAYVHYHSPMMVNLLNEIGNEEVRAGRPPLPAVVVSKTTRIPGAGYFKIDGLRDDSQAVDPKAYWEADLQRVFDYWSKHDS